MVENLVTRWCHLHQIQIQPPNYATCLIESFHLFLSLCIWKHRIYQPLIFGIFLILIYTYGTFRGRPDQKNTYQTKSRQKGDQTRPDQEHSKPDQRQIRPDQTRPDLLVLFGSCWFFFDQKQPFTDSVRQRQTR